MNCVCYEKIGMPIADLKGESYDIFRKWGRRKELDHHPPFERAPRERLPAHRGSKKAV